ncbi:MAG: hypothetical protein ACJ73S_27170 [Mycobacteriales bacterium]|jgi:hypothetical protein
MLHTARRLAALAVGGLLLAPVVALVQAVPAQAGSGFGYTCEVTNAPDEELNAGALDCQPQAGAPAVGVITREFKIFASGVGPDLDCFGGGVASTPTSVTGVECVIV